MGLDIAFELYFQSRCRGRSHSATALTSVWDCLFRSRNCVPSAIEEPSFLSRTQDRLHTGTRRSSSTGNAFKLSRGKWRSVLHLQTGDEVTSRNARWKIVLAILRGVKSTRQLPKRL